MLTPAVVGLLIGMALGQRLRVLVLAPVILLIVMLAFVTAVLHLQNIWAITKTAVIAIVTLQTGYLVAIGIRHLVIPSQTSRLGSSSGSKLRSR